MPGDVWEVTLRHTSRVVAGALESGLKQSEVGLSTQKHQMVKKEPRKINSVALNVVSHCQIYHRKSNIAWVKLDQKC